MKLKVKYSSTQKFIIRLEDRTLGNLRNEIKKFIENTYNETVNDPLILSLNGSDPLIGSDDALLASLGVVPGDLLTILPPSAVAKVEEPQQSTLSSSSSSALVSTSSTSQESGSSSETDKRMESDSVPQDSAAQVPRESGGGSDKFSLLEVKDGLPSPTLEKLFTKCSPASASQAVNLIVHLTMLECSFHLESDLEIPPGWKEMVATFQYYHTSFPEFKCTLALVTMGEVKQVLASFPQQESTISVQVKVGEYLKDSSKTVIQAVDLIKVSQLSRMLRDHVLHPLHVAAHQALGVPAPWHLPGLPHEILLMIASSLGARGVLNLGQTCKRLHSAMEDNKLWRNLYKRDFKSLYGSMENYNLIDWKAKYREALQREKDWRRLYDETSEFIIPGMHPPLPPFGPPHPTMPYPDLPRPRGDPYYPPQPHPPINPFADPDSPFFGGEIPPIPNPLPNISDPFDPFGMRPGRPNRGGGPFNPPFMPRQPRNPRGPRFDFF